jgi:hypothetical protein
MCMYFCPFALILLILYLLNENMFELEFVCVPLYLIYPHAMFQFFLQLINIFSKRVCIIVPSV